MPERQSFAQVAQIGVEATPGTAVAATSRIGSLNVVPKTTAEVSTFTPDGLKFPSVAALNREWGEFSVDGQPTYEEVAKMLANVIGTPTIVQVMDGATPTGAYEWTMIPSVASADAPKTFTLEYGQSGVQAEKYAHMLGTSFSLSISRSGVSQGGGGILQAATTGITPTAGLTIPTTLTPMMPSQASFYYATSQAGLSAGRLLRAVSCDAGVTDRFNPAWFVNALVGSFTTWVENPSGVGGEVSLLLEADANGMQFYTNMRNGSTGYFRIEFVGANIYNAGTKPNLTFLFQWDIAFKVTDIAEMSDSDGIYAIPVTLSYVVDPTWGSAPGQAMTFLVRNKVSTLS